MTFKTLKILYFIIFMLSNNYSSQITINWNFEEQGQKATVKIYNDSNEKVALPIDIRSFQGYLGDSDNISDFEWETDYPFSAFVLKIYEKNSKKKLEINSSTPYIDLSEFDKKRLHT